MKYGIFSIFESKNNIWKIFQKKEKKIISDIESFDFTSFFSWPELFQFSDRL